MDTMTHQGTLDRAQRRAQRRFSTALTARFTTGVWEPLNTDLYLQAERLVDELIVTLDWERSKAELDFLQTHDHDYHVHSGVENPRCDDCAEANQAMWARMMRTY